MPDRADRSRETPERGEAGAAAATKQNRRRRRDLTGIVLKCTIPPAHCADSLQSSELPARRRGKIIGVVTRSSSREPTSQGSELCARNAFSGLCMAIIQATKSRHDSTGSDGGRPDSATVQIEAEPAKSRPAIA